MDNSFDFTKNKFLSFPLTWQHKQCAELLTQIYNLSNENELWQKYRLFLQWMQEDTQVSFTHKQTADRIHWHYEKAQVSRKEHRLLPLIRKGDKQQAEESWPIAIYLDHIRSAHNVGSIIRTVEAFSLGSVVFSQNTPFITHSQVKHTAMETEKWVDCRYVERIELLPKPIIALETSPTALSLYDFDFPDRFTLAVGNEEYGCSDELLQLADTIIEIPLRGRKNSLNVANAFALTAGEIARQRELKKRKL